MSSTRACLQQAEGPSLVVHEPFFPAPGHAHGRLHHGDERYGSFLTHSVVLPETQSWPDTRVLIPMVLTTGFCGIMSIFSSLRYCLGDPTEKSNLYLALAFLPFGLFFDFLDGRVARWRKKSSMMGQELDSLADLVCCPPLLPTGLFAICFSSLTSVNEILLATLDFLRSCPRLCRLQSRSAHHARPCIPGCFRSVRPDAAGALQRHGSQHPSRCFRKGQLLRGHTYPHHAGHRCPHGLLGLTGLGARPGPRWCLARGLRSGVPPRCADVPCSRLPDDQQVTARP